jgi:hypothetical protein
VEAAWGKVAQDIGQDPGYAVDNIKEHEMDSEVTKFEESILFFADAHRLHGPGSRFRDQSSASSQTPIESHNGSCITTPPLAREPSPPISIKPLNDSKRFSFGHRLLNLLNFSTSEDVHIKRLSNLDDDFVRESDIDSVGKINDEGLEAWQLEAASVDRAIQILPGVKRIIDSIPAGRYAVATSGAKTYGIFSFLSHIHPYNIFPLFFFAKPTAA